MPSSDSTLTATISYEGTKRAKVSDLTVELVPLVVALNGTAITSYTVAVTPYWEPPTVFAAPSSAGASYGVLVGPGTAHVLATGQYRVWVRYVGSPETITRRADGWIEIFGTDQGVLEELAGAGAYQLRAERGVASGYATLGVDGVVPAGQLPVASGGTDPTKQDADADLTAIAALTPTNDDLLQRKAGAWTNRTPAQLKTDLGLSNPVDTTDYRLDGRPLGVPLTSGETTSDRRSLTLLTTAQGSGTMTLTYFTSRKTETIGNLEVLTGGTAGASLTLARLGVYSVAGNGDLTLIASIANDTTLYAATFTKYPRALSATWAKVAGTTYAIGSIITGSTMPILYGDNLASASVVNAIRGYAPRYSGAVTGQTDLPSSVPAGSVIDSRNNPFVVMLP